MNNRERFLNTMRYEKVDHPPFYNVSVWKDTLARWHKEGYPQHVELEDYFGIDRLKHKSTAIDTWVIPEFEQKVLHEDEDIIISTNCFGAKIKNFKNKTSMPEWLEYRVKTASDLEEVIDRLKPNLDGRIPQDWDKQGLNAENRDWIVQASGGSYYGILRNLMGMEAISLMIYDSPETIKRYLDAYHAVIMVVLEEVLSKVKVDYLWFGEDLAYNKSSLISPAMFRELLLPKYKHVINFARNKNIEIFFFDSDGNINEMLPHLMEAGINLIFPVECAAGMDPVELRKRYGKHLAMIGGIDKRELAKDKKAIKNEVFKKVPVLIKEGGYFPCIDHSVSSDISLENYTYYIDLLKDLFGAGG